MNIRSRTRTERVAPSFSRFDHTVANYGLIPRRAAPHHAQPGPDPGGVALLQSVTATGCAQGALCAAFLGAGAAPDEALLQASRLMKRAGERAWEMAKTPGSFQVALVDALYALTHHD